MAGAIRKLRKVEENDAVDSFDHRARWVVYGYTREELAAIADVAIVDEFTPRTVYLAKFALIATIPEAIGVAQLVKVHSVEEDDSDNVYEFDVEYAAGAAAPAPGYSTTPAGGPTSGPSIRLSTQAVNVQVPRGPIRVYPKTGETAPDAPRGILPDGSGGYRGADVVVPALSWSEPHVVAAANFSLAKGLELIGKTNAMVFRGFAAGTVLCVGAAADQRPTGEWDISLEFQHGDYLDGPAPGFTDFDDVFKEGWEFLFPLTNEAGEVVALCVAPLYDSVNFGAIVPSLADV